MKKNVLFSMLFFLVIFLCLSICSNEVYADTLDGYILDDHGDQIENWDDREAWVETDIKNGYSNEVWHCYYRRYGEEKGQMYRIIDIRDQAERIDNEQIRLSYGCWMRNYILDKDKGSFKVYAIKNDFSSVFIKEITDDGDNTFKEKKADNLVIPIGTRMLKFVLFSERKSGYDCDAYFDDLWADLYDVGAPVAKSVTITSTDPFVIKAGDTIEINVELIEEATLTGTAKIKLNLADDAYAKCTLCDNSKTMKFKYTVREQDLNIRLGFSSSPSIIVEEGGGIKDAYGNNTTNINLSRISFYGDSPFIDTHGPKVTFNPNGSLEARRDYNVSVTLSDEHVQVNIDNTQFQWVKEGSQISEDNWISCTNYSDNNTLAIKASDTGVVENGNYCLHVKAVDTLGNLTETNSAIFNIDMSASYNPITITPAGSKSYNKEYDITIETDDNSPVFYQWSDSNNINDLDDNSWTLGNTINNYGQGITGSQYLHVKTTVDGIKYTSYVDFYFDNIAPSISVSPSNSIVPMKALTAEVSADDNFTVDPILYAKWKLKNELGDDESQWNDSIYFTEEYKINGESTTIDDGDGEYILFVKAKDDAANESIYHTGPFVLDNTPPIGNVSIETLTSTTGAVTVGLDVTDNISDISDIKYTYSIDGCTWNQQWIPVSEGLEVRLSGNQQNQNVSVQVKFKDKAGNESDPFSSSGDVTYNPEGVITWVEYSTTEWTNEPVTVYLKYNGGTIEVLNNGGSNTYQFTENGTFYFEVKDDQGVIKRIKAQAYNIDTEVLQPVITYSTKKPTNGMVEVTLKPKESVTVLNNDGNLSYSFTQNGRFTFELQDAVGNTGSIEVVVNNIDSQPPVLGFTKSTAEPTRHPVKVTLTSNEKVIVMNNLGIMSRDFKENESFTFKVKDMAGNESELTVTVDNIDKTPPVAQVQYSTTSWTNEPVTATVTSDEDIIVLNNNGSTTHVFNRNGVYYFKVADRAGNWCSVKAQVLNIDDTPPVITFTEEYAIFSRGEDFTLNDFTAEDDVAGNLTSDVQVNLNGFDISIPGTYEVIYSVVDTAGNVTNKTRNIMVIPKGELRIFINGNDISNMDKIFIYKPYISMKIFNNMGHITVKWKKGKVSPTSMKTRSNIIEREIFEPQELGWYTIYIQDQERNTKKIYVYVSSTN